MQRFKWSLRGLSISRGWLRPIWKRARKVIVPRKSFIVLIYARVSKNTQIKGVKERYSSRKVKTIVAFRQGKNLLEILGVI